MFVKDAQGQWYEVADRDLQDRKIPAEKVLELQAGERAEARKKAAELLAAQDEDTIAAIRDSLGLPVPGRPGGIGDLTPGGGVGPVGVNDCWNNDCHTNDCHTNDCHTNDCHGNDCHSEYGGEWVNPRDWVINPRIFSRGRVIMPTPQLARRRR